MNPLLDFSGLPRFADIQPEHVTPAVDQLLEENRALVERIATAAEMPAWEVFVPPLDDANERLSRAWGQVENALKKAMAATPESPCERMKQHDERRGWRAGKGRRLPDPVDHSLGQRAGMEGGAHPQCH
jgi:Zn-dependent oligopeptidase